MIYNAEIDAFIGPKPYPSCVLDTVEANWKAPVAEPTEGGPYVWNESTLSWVAAPQS